MHYTFIPDIEKNDLRKEYRIRAAIVFLFFISISIVIGIGTLFPAYISATIEQGLQVRDANALKSKPDAVLLNNTKKELAESSALISALKDYTTDNDFSKYINEIVNIRGNVKISELFLDKTATEANISIRGVSRNREELLAFKKRLTNLVPGTTVDLPISQLAKESDLNFSIRVVQPIK